MSPASPDPAQPRALWCRDVDLGYRDTRIVHSASLALRSGRVVALVGPNGSGKSTLLRALSRLHPRDGGTITLGEDDGLESFSAKEFSRRVTMLSQNRPHPHGLTVADVVAFGRHPYRRRFAAPAPDDHEAITWALTATGTEAMAHRAVDELSGGELQRVWLATCLAQRTGVLMLDEPTNHLDLRYQVEVLDLARDLADEHDVAIGLVLHDLDQAASVADEIVLLHEGRVRASGLPEDVLTTELLTEVYGLPIDVVHDHETGHLRTVPRGRRGHHRSRLTPSTNEVPL